MYFVTFQHCAGVYYDSTAPSNKVTLTQRVTIKKLHNADQHNKQKKKISSGDLKKCLEAFPLPADAVMKARNDFFSLMILSSHIMRT